MSGKPRYPAALRRTILALGWAAGAWARALPDLARRDGFAESFPAAFCVSGRYGRIPISHRVVYVTANLSMPRSATASSDPVPSAMRSGPPQPGWANQQIWMAMPR